MWLLYVGVRYSNNTLGGSAPLFCINNSEELKVLIMPFTMSGNYDGWSYNRFDKYEADLKGEKSTEEVEEETLGEVEEINEISKGTLGSYVDKAKKDLVSRGKQQMKDHEAGEFEPDRQDAMGEYIGPKDKDSRIKTRGKGIRMAKDKLKK